MCTPKVLGLGAGIGRETVARLVVALFPLSLFPTVFAQEIQWTRQFGTASTDSADGVAVDGAGNVYVVGATDGVPPG